MLQSVLVTDGNYRHTLALLRAISGYYQLHVGAEQRNACCFYSRFVKGRMLYSTRTPEQFFDSIQKYSKAKKIHCIVPVGDTTCFYASMYKEKIEAEVPISNIESMNTARNKLKMMDKARRYGFKVPNVIESLNNPRFPLVLKPVYGRGNLQFVNNKKELRQAVKLFKMNDVPFFVTEYVPGFENLSFAGLFKKGKLQVFFIYRELREFPLTGGSATYAVSIYDSYIKERCRKLLEGLNWHGVAMVEFKLDLQGTPYFMEVNPKFWASLELAIRCGVNFPLLLLKMCEGEKIEQPKYIVGKRFRWVLEDVLSFLSKPSVEFLKSVGQRSSIDVHLDDLPAHFLRVLNKFRRVYYAKRRLKTFRLGYPYGIPVTE
ncbi:MAG: hypothetical protein DRI61_10315 [Chloroflexi bacterium]|nr:MAG: hypothetical protein DRI61_10315 [Chloroflexota bacterium]